jgi:hypothetical protein
MVDAVQIVAGDGAFDLMEKRPARRAEQGMIEGDDRLAQFFGTGSLCPLL